MTSPFAPALERARHRYSSRRPRAAELHRAARAVMPGGSTRSVLDVDPFPIRIAQAAGARLVDVDGHEYVDFLGDYSAGLHGHDPALVADAVRAVLDRGWTYGATHVDEVRFAEAIVARFPSIERVRFTNSGTEANLMAIQVARHHTGRDRIAVADLAYHGGLLYFGHGGEALLAPFDFARFDYNDVDSMAAAVGDDVAAVLVEPMMGAAGCIPARADFLRAVRRRCDEVGALLVFDEVMTSRSSAGGQQARLGVLPDMTTLGKYLAGGMTFGAFGGRADVMAAFDPASGGELTHGGTFNNNAITMAAGAVAVTELLAPGVLDVLFARGDDLQARIAAVFATTSLPLSVTGLGSLMTLHSVRGPVDGPRDLAASDPVLKELLFHELLERGIYLAPRGYVALSTAIDDADCDRFVDALADAVAAIGREGR